MFSSIKKSSLDLLDDQFQSHPSVLAPSISMTHNYQSANQKELDGTRVKLGCEMRCEAGSNIDEREIENS
jgi:hypothetical protein